MPTIRLSTWTSLSTTRPRRRLRRSLGPAVKVALGPTPEEEKRQAARLIASRNAIYAGQMHPTTSTC